MASSEFMNSSGKLAAFGFGHHEINVFGRILAEDAVENERTYDVPVVRGTALLFYQVASGYDVQSAKTLNVVFAG
jgi:hypothetical protein